MAKLPTDTLHPLSRAEWRAWLTRHHARDTGIWLISFKKGTGKPRIDYEKRVEEASCFGWMDSKPNKLDGERAMLWFATRKAGSGWSGPNKERAERTLRAGLLHSAGLAKIEQARADGPWTIPDAVEELKLPPDPVAALAVFPRGRQHIDAIPRCVKRGILEWIQAAKRTEKKPRASRRLPAGPE